MIETLATGVIFIVVIIFAVWLFVLLPYGMAKKRGRSVVLWVLVSLLLSPVVAILVLWLLGDTPNRHRDTA